MSVSRLPNRLVIKNGKHLTMSEKSVDTVYPWHWHSFFEIEIILSGKGDCIINDLSHEMEAENLYLLSSTDFHHVLPKEPLRIINISFDETMVDERFLGELLDSQRDREYRLKKEDYGRILAAVELLRHECEIDGDCQKNLLQYILSCILREDKRTSKKALSELNYRGIRSSITYMEAHFKESVTLKRLAAEAGYHPTYFSELFKKITGESYIETLNRLRISYSKTLLGNGFSVSDACFLSGFGSLSNFLSTFKKHCQMTPQEYRIKSRNSGN